MEHIAVKIADSIQIAMAGIPRDLFLLDSVHQVILNHPIANSPRG